MDHDTSKTQLSGKARSLLGGMTAGARTFRNAAIIAAGIAMGGAAMAPQQAEAGDLSKLFGVLTQGAEQMAEDGQLNVFKLGGSALGGIIMANQVDKDEKTGKRDKMLVMLASTAGADLGGNIATIFQKNMGGNAQQAQHGAYGQAVVPQGRHLMVSSQAEGNQLHLLVTDVDRMLTDPRGATTVHQYDATPLGKQMMMAQVRALEKTNKVEMTQMALTGLAVALATQVGGPGTIPFA